SSPTRRSSDLVRLELKRLDHVGRERSPEVVKRPARHFLLVAGGPAVLLDAPTQEIERAVVVPETGALRQPEDQIARAAVGLLAPRLRAQDGERLRPKRYNVFQSALGP